MKPWIDTTYTTIDQLARAYKRGERPRLIFKRHFIERMRSMKVTEDELFEAIAQPEQVTISRKHHACVVMSGRVAVSLCLDEAGYPDAITLLWRHREDWESAYASGTAGGIGRSRRDLMHLPMRGA